MNLDRVRTLMTLLKPPSILSLLISNSNMVLVPCSHVLILSEKAH
jgi:hypothetical protein